MRYLFATLFVLTVMAVPPLFRAAPGKADPSYTAGAPGDADCSGQVNAADALSTLSQLAGLISHPGCGADADGLGGTTIADVLTIRRWTAGLPVRPRLMSVSPGSITAGAPLTSFVVRGGLLSEDTTFAWGNSPLPMSVVDDGSVAVVEIPQSFMVSPGLVVITLSTTGASLDSEPLNFTIASAVACSPTQPGLTGTLTVFKVEERAVFTLSQVQNMTGWKLISSPNQVFSFPAGYVYNPFFGEVTVKSATAEVTNTQTWLWWTESSRWNNATKDDGKIVDCNNQVIAEWIDDDPPPAPTPG